MPLLVIMHLRGHTWKLILPILIYILIWIHLVNRNAPHLGVVSTSQNADVQKETIKAKG
jgi:hypothetical protein